MPSATNSVCNGAMILHLFITGETETGNISLKLKKLLECIKKDRRYYGKKNT